jgi:hypothetical protein
MARGPSRRALDANSFIFWEPLGEAREVHVALSHPFGRFVTRA